MAHKIDKEKCETAIDELMNKREAKAEASTLLKAELKLAKMLKVLYKKETLKWANRENELYMKILTLKKMLEAIG